MVTLKSSIVIRYLFIMGLTVSMVLVAGLYSGRVLIAKMAALLNDDSSASALRTGQEAIVNLRHLRTQLAESIVQACLKEASPLDCNQRDLPLGVHFELLKETALEGWESETVFIKKFMGQSYRIEFSWEEIRPLYLELTQVIATREHFSILQPRVERSFFIVLTLALLSAGALGLLATFWLGQRLRIRLSGLTAYATSIAGGDLGPAPQNSLGKDEIGVLAQSMEQMAKDLYQTREKLVFSEKMQSWQAVAKKLAHEIKNPLTPISLVADQLRRNQKLVPAALQGNLAEAARILEEEVFHLGRMVKEFTAFARLAEPKFERHDLGKIIEDFTLRNEKSGGPKFVIKSERPKCCTILADKGMLHQILHNLVNNACLAKAPELATIEFSLDASEDRIHAEIKDDGPGVPVHLRETLFDAYVSSRSTGEQAKGMGLGLTIARKIAADHQGSLVLLTTSEAGTTFRLSLPKCI